MGGIFSPGLNNSTMTTKSKDLHLLLAKTIVAQKTLDNRRRACVREINGRCRALRLVTDALAVHDLEETELPLTGTDSISPAIMQLIEAPLEGL
jgi:hypothetical protein